MSRVELIQFLLKSRRVELKICSTQLELNWKYEQLDFKLSWIQKVNLKLDSIISLLLHKKLQKNIQFLSKHSALYVNKWRNKEFTFKEKNKVYLLQWNIKIKWLSNKLNYMKLRLFAIKTVKRSINYKLNLSTFMKIYLIFNIFLLKFADSETSL